ncbi:hypothetical protein vBEcoMWL3_gp184 [Escherichia phage vB_EcoM_WL-3]|nr:hypothetical protein vBEcoMWL3_gp184 [Escherichia phage vB_EcoM_WL-3]
MILFVQIYHRQKLISFLFIYWNLMERLNLVKK